jgi:8-oxo-dGTP diphosphatase
MSFTYEYERPALTVDIVLFTKSPFYENHDEVETLLVKRKQEPFRDSWVFPGGFVNKGEKLIDAARRELFEETNVNVNHLTPLGIYDDPDRDPRGWTVSSAHLGLINKADCKLKAQEEEVEEVKWFSLREAFKMKLGFDHNDMLRSAVSWFEI